MKASIVRSHSLLAFYSSGAPLFRIKICGLTTLDDALHAVQHGADALGLNFYSRSPRSVSPEAAALIVEGVEASEIAPAVNIGGVFVNESDDRWRDYRFRSGIHFSQFHGDEPAEYLGQLLSARNTNPVMYPYCSVKAFRCQGTNLADVRRYLEACQKSGGLPDAILLDAFSPNAYGGTGAVIDWHVVRDQRDQFLGLPVILAGGLTPDNVAEAIRTARPDGVDVASGVELSPGKKDRAKVRDFIAAARAAFDELGN
jgi:phosphoribosylanthranilate isomerase